MRIQVIIMVENGHSDDEFREEYDDYGQFAAPASPRALTTEIERVTLRALDRARRASS